MAGPKTKWKPGQSGNPSGRPAKAKLEIHDAVVKVYGKSLAEVLLDMAAKNPRDAKEILLSLLRYIYPTLSSAQVQAKVDSTLMAKAQELMEKPDHELIELNQQLLKEAKEDGSNSG